MSENQGILRTVDSCASECGWSEFFGLRGWCYGRENNPEFPVYIRVNCGLGRNKFRILCFLMKKRCGQYQREGATCVGILKYET